MDDLTESVQFIDIQYIMDYLGTENAPQNIVYDKPYIWLIMEKDEQILLIKLLPKE